MYDEAQNYLKRIIKRDPENIQYRLDVGLVYVRSGDLNKADKYYKDIINDVKSNVQLAKMMSDYLAARSLTEYSVAALTESRQFLGNPFLFCLDLAMLYRIITLKKNLKRSFIIKTKRKASTSTLNQTGNFSLLLC